MRRPSPTLFGKRCKVMLAELALGTMAALGASMLQDYIGIWPLKRTWDAVGLKTKFEHVPLIVSNKATKYGRRVVVHLPSGISTEQFLRHLPHMEEQMRATIQAQAWHSTVELEIVRTPLPTDVPFRLLENKGKKHLPIAIGATGLGDALLEIDLARLPHLFDAGNTGGGKTTFAHGLCVQVVYNGAELAVIDLKRVEFGYLSRVATIANTEKTAARLLEMLNTEMDRRLALLEKLNLVHAKDYKGDDMPWMVLVIDELAELTDKDAQEALNRLCRLSRAAGICIVACTQRPSHTLYKNFTDTRALFAGRLCFTVPSAEDSRMVLGDDSASRLPRNIPGRAIFQWDGIRTVQCMNLSVDDARELISRLPDRKAAFSLEQHTKVLQP